jgi:hypothetical protein
VLLVLICNSDQSCRSQQIRAAPIAVAVMLVHGAEVALWRNSVRNAKPGMASGLLRWYHDHLQRERPAAQRGFDIANALSAAHRLSDNALPIVLVTGALALPGRASQQDGDETAPGHDAVLQQISDAQQASAQKRQRCVHVERSALRSPLFFHSFGK